MPKTVAVAVLVVAVVAVGCRASVDTSSATARAQPTVRPTEVVAAIDPVDEPAPIDDVRGELDSVGLEVERVVDLPGTGEQALVILVDGTSALDAWQRARSLVDRTGRYPVVFGHDTLDRFQGDAEWMADQGVTVTAELDIAAGIDPVDWFDQRIEYLEVDPSELEASVPLPAYRWPKNEFTFNRDVLSGEVVATAELVLFPTPRSWEIPAFLLWGAWNDVPSAGESVAIFESWNETYGAEIVSFDFDTIEMRVMSPPATELEAIGAAREHFLVAPDLVWQGTIELDLLAAAVLDAQVWYFWWD